jgi:ubiquinone/menaquinone biosynthesis C-methylase UbiE
MVPIFLGPRDVVGDLAGGMPMRCDDFFDRVSCVHVLNSLERLDLSPREIAHVLKSGGRLGLLFRTKADPAAVASFRSRSTAFPALVALTAAPERAGLDVHAASDCTNEPALLLATKPLASNGT